MLSTDPKTTLPTVESVIIFIFIPLFYVKADQHYKFKYGCQYEKLPRILPRLVKSHVNHGNNTGHQAQQHDQRHDAGQDGYETFAIFHALLLLKGGRGWRDQ